MELKSYCKTVTVVEQNDLERFIAHHMQMPEYNIADAEEASNGVKLEYRVSDDIDEATRKEVEAMMGKPYRSYRTGNILDYLCSEGVLKPGTYLIDVSW